jgi:hypothetical protein
LGTEETCDHFSLNVSILGKTAVLHLAHFCGWGRAKLSLQFIRRSCAYVLHSPQLPLFNFLNAPNEAHPQGVVFTLYGIQLKKQENR